MFRGAIYTDVAGLALGAILVGRELGFIGRARRA
jgi:hypothetical protein